VRQTEAARAREPGRERAARHQGELLPRHELHVPPTLDLPVQPPDPPSTTKPSDSPAHPSNQILIRHAPTPQPRTARHCCLTSAHGQALHAAADKRCKLLLDNRFMLMAKRYMSAAASLILPILPSLDPRSKAGVRAGCDGELPGAYLGALRVEGQGAHALRLLQRLPHVGNRLCVVPASPTPRRMTHFLSTPARAWQLLCYASFDPPHKTHMSGPSPTLQGIAAHA
jgi:hypothetical protein